MQPRSIESRIQDLVYNVDVGIGLKLTKAGMFLLFIFFIMTIYTATQFFGLRDAEAMDYAQLGRNIAQTGSFETKVIRPAAIWFLSEKRGEEAVNLLQHPDLFHPPLYPLLLAGGFKVFGSSFPSDEIFKAIPPEQWVITPLNHTCTLVTAFLLFLAARRFFDPRIAIFAVSVFALSDIVWNTSISGLNLSLLMMLATFAFYFLLSAHERLQEDMPLKTWLIPVALSGLFCGLAVLTRYAGVVVFLAGLIYLLSAVRTRPALAAGVFGGVFLLVISPWLVRNMIVAGNPFAMALYAAFNPASSDMPFAYEQMLHPDAITSPMRDLQIKFLVNLKSIFEQDLFLAGGGLLTSLFLVTYFFSFVRDHIRQFRWALLAGIGALVLLASAFGATTSRALMIFMPFIILYGLTFYFILLDRLQITIPLVRAGIHAAVIAACALPLVMTILPPRAALPYPPYNPAMISHVTRMLEQDELICSDIPWATAWYGDQPSLLLPNQIDDFYSINDLRKRISGLYFTTVTRDLPFVRSLMTGPYSSWYPIFRERIPADFPLKEAFFLHQKDQLFLTDRPRWLEQR